MFILTSIYSNVEKDISLELENISTGVYDIIDDKSHHYEVVAKVKTPPTSTVGKDGINLNQCPAYVPDTPNTLKRDDLYETITLP